MIQSIEDYENWRDSLYTGSQPDYTPDEQVFRFYSYDSPDDTTLEYVRMGDRAELRLSFNSEGPDADVEQMCYGGDAGESMAELVSDLRAELTAQLDAADTSSFYEQQNAGIHRMENEYSKYTRSALYAFKDILEDTEAGLERQITWKAIEPDKKDWLYSCGDDADAERGCIGHLRGDFGRDGNEFWIGWFDHQDKLKSADFQDELQSVVNALHEKGGLLSNFASMSRQCREGTYCDDSFGFHGESKNYEYCLRCIPRRGDYNFYVYSYDKNAQREHALAKAAEKAAEQPTVKPKRKKNEMER